MNLDNLKEALVEEFVKEEDPKKVWQELQGMMQEEEEPIGKYIQRFSSLWEELCKALQPQVPPEMMKKDCFMTGLKASLRLRVELKKPRSCEDVWMLPRGKSGKSL